MVERVGAAEAADVLARAFYDDPVLTYLIRPCEVRLVLGAPALGGHRGGDRAGGRLVENVPWCRHFGFEVTEELHAVPGAPPSWGMRRGG